jgi:hypothetical protein
MFRPRIQTKQILAGTLTAEFSLNSGSEYPENVWAYMVISAMSGSEVLDITGRAPGVAGYTTAVLVTQIDLKANDADTVLEDLSGDGPLTKILFTATNIAAAETVDITIVSW